MDAASAPFGAELAANGQPAGQDALAALQLAANLLAGMQGQNMGIHGIGHGLPAPNGNGNGNGNASASMSGSQTPSDYDDDQDAIENLALLGAGASRRGGRATSGRGTHVSAKEKNRQAQRRFRERQKNLISTLKERVDYLGQKAKDNEEEIRALRDENARLRLHLLSADATAQPGLAAGAVGVTGAAAPAPTAAPAPAPSSLTPDEVNAALRALQAQAAAGK